MNERIKELYTQALEYADSVVPAERRYNDIYYAIVSGKHAELIVRECMSLCTDVEEDVELADYVGSFRDGALMCREDIKKHFGIEEN
jgi:hypothetical protein